MIVSVKDGKTPYIGANGNWWIGETDTGVKAEYTESDPTVPAWAKEATKPTYTASEVGAVKSGGDQVSGTYELQGELYFAHETEPKRVNITSDGVDIYGTDGKGVCISTDGGDGYVDGTPELYLSGSDGDEAVRLKRIESPSDDHDAANKLYVDSRIKYGTADVTAGSASSYPEGTLYVVIE